MAAATDTLPIWPDAPSVEAEAGVRMHHGRLDVFDLDARAQGRVARLIEVQPAPDSLTDSQLTAAIYACRATDGRGHDAYHNAVLIERERRQAAMAEAA